LWDINIYYILGFSLTIYPVHYSFEKTRVDNSILVSRGDNHIVGRPEEGNVIYEEKMNILEEVK